MPEEAVEYDVNDGLPPESKHDVDYDESETDE
jgi:hypothetical protein